MKGIKVEESRREYLLLEEIQKLVQTECKIPVLKQAFIFGTLTGLRWSDTKARLEGNQILRI